MPSSLLFVLIAAGVFVVVYVAGRAPATGGMVEFLFTLISSVLKRFAEMFEAFKTEQTAKNKHSGLRSIFLIVAFVFALIALSAEVYTTMQSLVVLFGDGFTLPQFPPLLASFFSFSVGWLFISVAAIFGMLVLEEKKLVGEEFRIFVVTDENKAWFHSLVSVTFTLALITTACYYGLRALYLTSTNTATPNIPSPPPSPAYILLDAIVLILLGVLVVRTGMIAAHICVLGIQVLFSTVATIIWYAVTILSDIAEQSEIHFHERPRKGIAAPASAPLLQAAPTIEVLLASQAVLDRIVSDVEPREPKLPPYPGRTRERFPIVGTPDFEVKINRILDELNEKVPQYYTPALEYLPEARQDLSIISTRNAIGLSDGRFAFDEMTPYSVALQTLCHELGHCIYVCQHGDTSEDAANDFASMVVAKIEEYEVKNGNA